MSLNAAIISANTAIAISSGDSAPMLRPIGQFTKSNASSKFTVIVFASFLHHRVAPVTRGVRQSLVMWFGGEPFK
mgnify:CR=1 FL=1